MTVAIVENQTGAMPQKFPFEPPLSGDVTIAVSATCWSKFAASTAGLSLYLDGNKLGDIPLFFNNASEHMALPTHFFSVNLDFGQHVLAAFYLTDHTVCDQNDYFSAWIID